MKLNPVIQKALSDLKAHPPITAPPLRKISSIQCGILSPEEIKDVSVQELTNPRVSQPPTGSVYDDRMGPYTSHGVCLTCSEDIHNCPGHFGHIDLQTPIINPLYMKYLIVILNCVCLDCSKLKIPKEHITLEINAEGDNDRIIRYADRLALILEKCKKIECCTYCQQPHPKIVENGGFVFKYYGKAKPSRIEIDELQAILMGISSEDLTTIGFKPEVRRISKNGIVEEIPTFRPEWLIITCLPVIPSMSRPPANEGDLRSDDDLTTSYSDIIKYNEKLKDPALTEKSKSDLTKLLIRHIGALFDNSNGELTRNSGKPAKGIKERIIGKQGHLRGKIMGKRVDCSARTVITADPNIRLNDVGVPEEIAKILSFPEKITSRNVAEMTQLLNEGKINTLVRGRKSIRVQVALQAGREISLVSGDIVYRHLRDGDTGVFNRQPSLHRPSMMGHVVRVLPGKTFRLNPSATTPYNADFDGG